MKKIILSLFVLFAFADLAAAQTTAFTYQGKLTDGGGAPTGQYDFTFTIFAANAGGSPVASVAVDDVQVTAGVFTVQLDFGNAPFPVSALRWLEIAVRPGSSAGAFTPLAPRQAIATTPYAMNSIASQFADTAINSATATNALNLGGVAPNQFVLTGDARLSDARNPLPNSPNYIQNATTPQSSSNFNISGNGTVGGTLSANIVNAATQFNIDATRVLSAPTGTANLYAGFGAGINTGTGTNNSAFGYYAGELSNSGGNNSYFGHFSGRSSTGSGNSFFGSSAGRNNLGGGDNTFIGINAGFGNTVGSSNTLLGAGANVLSNDLTFATAIGAGATVNRNNQIVLGRSGGQDDVVIPGILTANGSGLTNLNAAGITSGTLAIANGGTGSSTKNFVDLSTNQDIGGNKTFAGNSQFAGDFFAYGLNNRIVGLLVRPLLGNAIVNFQAQDSYYSQTIFSDHTNTYRGYIGYIGANAGLDARNDTVEFGTNGKDLTFRPNNTEVMRFKSSGRIGIGTINPNYKFELIDASNTGLRVQTNTAGGTVASFGGTGEFSVDAPFVPGGRFRITEAGNVGIGGTVFSDSKLTVSGAGIVRTSVNSDSNAGLRLLLNNQAKWSVAATSPGNFQIFNDANGQNAMIIDTGNNVAIGGATNAWKLSVNTGGGFGLLVNTGTPGGSLAEFGANGEFNIANASSVGGRLNISEDGTMRINNPPLPGTLITNTFQRLVVNGVIRSGLSGAGIAPLCHNPLQEMSVCVSSVRYKENINDFKSGLSLIRQLRPVSFVWKQNGAADLGLVAEEVAAVEPLLATFDYEGNIQGVKYDRLGVVLVNAVREQQQIIERQQQQIDALRRIICEFKPEAAICKEEQK